ncbi:MAG: hypothetical protein J6T18_04800 [Bacteroidaceae bacterium]|nr:hypothetical protein [Bacteroidaceae bacterium]
MDGLINRKIERESELVAAIESYVDLGDNAKKPLMIKLTEGWGRREIVDYLKDKYKKDVLLVRGHPFKGHIRFVNEKGETELISNHPELTTNFYAPTGYKSNNKPLFLMANKEFDYSFNPDYYEECVQQLSIPFVYFAPNNWFDFDNNMEAKEVPEILNEYESLLYSPTVKGWLEDMCVVRANLPNQIRLIEKVNTYLGYSILRERGIDLSVVESRIRANYLEQRIKNLLGFAESIKGLDSFDELCDLNMLDSGWSDSENHSAEVTYLLEKLLSSYYSLFTIRLLVPDYKPNDYDVKCIEVEKQFINNLSTSFAKYLENTDDNWVFDFSRPVPDNVLKELKDVLSVAEI